MEYVDLVPIGAFHGKGKCAGENKPFKIVNKSLWFLQAQKTNTSKMKVKGTMVL